MLEAFYATERGSLEDATINGGFDLHPELVWIDLIAPSQEEQQWVLDAYDRNLPTLKSLEDISSSARFYRDDDGILHISTYFLTKNKNYQVDGDTEDSSNILAMVQTVAFILHKDRLFTLRGEKLVAFRAFRARARRNDYDMDYKDPTWILLGLLEAKLDELADILEDIHKDLEKYSTEVLNNHHREQMPDLDDMITRLAQQEDVLGKARLCLIDLRRVLTFLARPRARAVIFMMPIFASSAKMFARRSNTMPSCFKRCVSYSTPRLVSLTPNRTIRFVASRSCQVC